MAYKDIFKNIDSTIGCLAEKQIDKNEFKLLSMKEELNCDDKRSYLSNTSFQQTSFLKDHNKPLVSPTYRVEILKKNVTAKKSMGAKGGNMKNSKNSEDETLYNFKRKWASYRGHGPKKRGKETTS